MLKYNITYRYRWYSTHYYRIKKYHTFIINYEFLLHCYCLCFSIINNFNLQMLWLINHNIFIYLIILILLTIHYYIIIPSRKVLYYIINIILVDTY